MSDEWYYAEDGRTVGPVSAGEIAERIGKAGERAHLVWSPGMSQWAEARTLPAFARRQIEPPSEAQGETASSAKPKASLAQRARHELIAYIAVSSYLMVWFSAVMFYKATVLRSVGVEFTPFGIAVVKALILGKFILLLDHLKLGDRRASSILIVQIVKKALLFTLALVVMTVIEEVVVGHFHGRAIKDVLGEMGGGSLPQAFAMGVLMFLVLVPYLAFRSIALELGQLPELLFTRRSLSPKA